VKSKAAGAALNCGFVQRKVLNSARVLSEADRLRVTPDAIAVLDLTRLESLARGKATDIDLYAEPAAIGTTVTAHPGK
jgi:hypothetical protein